MKDCHTGLSWLLILITILILPFYFSACQSEPANNQRSWIDFPYQNAHLSAGSPIPLFAHVYADNGIAEVQCSIDGVPYQRGAPQLPGSTFSAYEQEVIINDPGVHLISVFVYDVQGNASNPAYVAVYIAPAVEGSSPTIAPTEEILEEPTTAPPSKVEISLWADQTQLQQGGCTNIHWNVLNADTVMFDGGIASTSGYQQVCPAQNKTYTIIASTSKSRKQDSITISVSSPAPSDGDAPIISKVSHSPGKIWNYSTCGPVSFTVDARVSDASAVSNVAIRFRVKKNGETGSWVERSLSGSGGNYQVTLNPDDLKQSMASYRGLVEYSISAQDEHGNQANSGTQQIEIQECLL